MGQETEDKGHIDLIRDLEIVQNEAKNFEFHDFKNQKYAMPKASLIHLLEAIVENVKDGKYDN